LIQEDSVASVALGAHYEEFVRRQVESGRYTNASEVVRAGLRMLEDREAARERWLREEIPARLGELRSGAVEAIPAEDVFSALKARNAASKNR
jgi:antitoxin ParD1/3/4